MSAKLEKVVQKYKEIESQLSDPEIASNPDKLKRLSQEHSDLKPLVEEFQRNQKLVIDYKENKELLADSDSEMVTLAREELTRIEAELEDSRQKIRLLLLPKDPNDDKNILLEIRAGAGGDEAGLFVADLFRMYQKFAADHGWSVDVLSSSPTGIGGLKEIIASISGNQVYSQLKWEAGVHRVQRVPDTETQGRVHTSTVTVAILPEAEEVDVKINPADLRIDVYRASGAGGQHVNTTDSAVRITHIPTGVVVTCQDERSQHKNKDKAMKVLRSKLYESELARTAKEESDARKVMVGTGDRSERIRTYNFPQGRLTDHRIGLTVYDLPVVMEGKIDEVIDAIQAYYQTEALKSQDMGL